MKSFGSLLPHDDQAQDYLSRLEEGDIVYLKDVSRRDIKFHRAFMGLLSYIWTKLPEAFRKRVPQRYFYVFIKELRGDYEYQYRFPSGREVKVYKSISFARMSQEEFEQWVAEVLPFIYEDIIRPLLGERADEVIREIESEWENFLNQLR